MQVEKLGPYRIGKKIGKGGMGAVYEAVSEIPGEALGQRVAIKALSPQLAMAEGFRERFEAEIESLKKLDHQGIVRLYGYGEQDGILFYSMELVDGTSLEEELGTGRRFDWRETLKIGIQICRALKHAHDHGVVHRDIKPANLMLSRDDRVKIADFGIARLFGGTQLTTAGGVLGTADYMSPEQADGRAVTEKCDQYSLGGVLFALLAGRPPFRAKTMLEMLQKQRFAEPEPVIRYAPDTPRQLDRLISQLLAKEPDDRFPNVLVLGRHMEAMEKALSRPVVPNISSEGDSDSQLTNPVPLVLDGNFEDMPTQAIEASLAAESDAADISLDVIDAPTLAKPDESMHGSVDGSTGSSTGRSVGPSAASSLGSAVATHATTSLVTDPRETHFTTVDDEARRQREASRENRLARVGQLGALILALGTLIGGGFYLMRPASADNLLAAIHEKIEKEGTSDLRNVSDELEEFLSRFPNDPRVAELTSFQEQLEFQRFERRIRTKSRLRGDVGLSPIEKIYFEAMDAADDDPHAAAATLRALVALYDPEDLSLDGASDKPVSNKLGSDQRLLISARKQISKLSARAQAEAGAELRALHERMVAAKKLLLTDPERALSMYEAVVRIYGAKSWAKRAVEEARGAINRK